MPLRASSTSVLSRFASNQKGTIALLFALAAVPLLLAGGLAIDVMRYVSAKTALQSALDAGALAAAAATNLSTPARIVAAESVFDDNVVASAIGAQSVDENFTIAGDKVIASASFELPVGLMKLAGFSTMQIEAQSEINVPGKKKAEIALVLDYS
ncbi:MAG TPA: pilus assembly protein TadG-related protein, partial [Aestuariivirga sp.]|nr:pilus assembly protein TadG-related protein [Aestuariivirga sp.]